MPFCRQCASGKNFVTTFANSKDYPLNEIVIMKESKKKSQEQTEQEVNEAAHKQDHAQEKGKEQKKHEKEWEEKYEEQKDKYLRLAAEFDNYRKRSAKERLELISVAAEDTIKGLLPILDDMERAIKTLKESGAESAIIEGEELIFKKFFDYLKSKGLATIEAMDCELDTDFHEAIAQFPVEDAEKKNKIIDVVVNGYTLNGKVIRFARVVVGI